MARILVIDDEPDAQEYVGRYLEKLGHTCLRAASGRDALQVLLAEKPDLAILDVRMPEMDGVQLLEVLRSYLRWYSLPIIVLSAHITIEDINKFRDMGVVYIFHKGNFDLPDLGRAVADAVGPKEEGKMGA